MMSLCIHYRGNSSYTTINILIIYRNLENHLKIKNIQTAELNQLNE